MALHFTDTHASTDTAKIDVGTMVNLPSEGQAHGIVNDQKIEQKLDQLHRDNLSTNTDLQGMAAVANNTILAVDNIQRSLDYAVNTNLRSVELLCTEMNVETKGLSTQSNFVIAKLRDIMDKQKKNSSELANTLDKVACLEAATNDVAADIKSLNTDLRNSMTKIQSTLDNIQASLVSSASNAPKVIGINTREDVIIKISSSGEVHAKDSVVVEDVEGESFNLVPQRGKSIKFVILQP